MTKTQKQYQRPILRQPKGAVKDEGWKQRLYQLELAIAKETDADRKDNLIHLYNNYVSEFDSLSRLQTRLVLIGVLFSIILIALGYIFWLSLKV